MSARQFARETLTMKPIAAVFLIGAFLFFALVSMCIPAGIATQVIAAAALVFLILTATARANDIERNEPKWQFRRLGMVAVIGGCAQILWRICFEDLQPSWAGVMLLTGMAMSWATTPNQKPWWRFMAEPDQRAEPRASEPQT